MQWARSSGAFLMTSIFVLACVASGPRRALANPTSALPQPSTTSLDPPPIVHFCGAHCATWYLTKDHKGYAGEANTPTVLGGTGVVISRFGSEGVELYRSDPPNRWFPKGLKAVITGQIAPTGNRLVNAKIRWTFGQSGMGDVRFTWGSALDDIPGDDNPRGRPPRSVPTATSARVPANAPADIPEPTVVTSSVPAPTPAGPAVVSGTNVIPSVEAAWVPRKRLALLIGNSRYNPSPGSVEASVWPDLEDGPIKDADAVAARLRALGFEVVELKNQNLDQMNAALRAFGERIAADPDALALFYYSGHGARAPRDLGDEGEETYLIPVGTNLQYDVDAHSKAVGLIEVRNIMRRSRAGVVILNACRNNALRRPPTRAAGSRGLAAPENISGMLFAYSTSAGDVAENRPGQMSEYTELLVREIGRSGESLTGSFRQVRKQIALLHNSRLPELTDELNDDIVLAPR